MFLLAHEYQLLNVLKIKSVINQQDLKKSLTAILSSLKHFHSLEVVDRVGEYFN